MFMSIKIHMELCFKPKFEIENPNSEISHNKMSP